MNRFGTYKAHQLAPGDRFYIGTDKKKTVCEMIQHQPKVTPYRSYTHFYITNTNPKPQAIDRNTWVVFLRNSNS
jgi:hypothetical protein